VSTLFLAQIITIYSICPNPELLNPCKCINNQISCGGDQHINLKHMFKRLSQQLDDQNKHFNRFFLNNTAISELEENTFYEITFDNI